MDLFWCLKASESSLTFCAAPCTPQQQRHPAIRHAAPPHNHQQVSIAHTRERRAETAWGHRVEPQRCEGVMCEARELELGRGGGRAWVRAACVCPQGRGGARDRGRGARARGGGDDGGAPARCADTARRERVRPQASVPRLAAPCPPPRTPLTSLAPTSLPAATSSATVSVWPYLAA